MVRAAFSYIRMLKQKCCWQFSLSNFHRFWGLSGHHFC